MLKIKEEISYVDLAMLLKNKWDKLTKTNKELKLRTQTLKENITVTQEAMKVILGSIAL